ncbi:MAG: hypothetical protein Tsb009_16040 [Planctomycetaceae bacterium]
MSLPEDQSESHLESPPEPASTGITNSRRIWNRRFGDWFVNLPPVRNRVPLRYRPTLYLDSLYNVGTGAFICLFLLSAVVLKTIVGGTETHLAVLGAMFGGSSLLSPIVSYAGRKIPMRSLVVYPNLIVAGLLVATFLTDLGPTFFTLIVGLAFIFRVFPRVAEMNMYRVVYPTTHRGAAVGWVKAISAFSALAITGLGYWWFSFLPDQYWLLYVLVAAFLVGSALCYARIPISRRNVFAKEDGLSPVKAFWAGLKIFASDKRFLWYQIGFALAGFANHMAMVYVAQVLRTDVIGSQSMENFVPFYSMVSHWNLERETWVTLIVGFVYALLPTVLMMVSAVFWGRFLDRINPMNARALFNTFQLVAYALHAYGGLTLQIWPIVLGATLHAIGNGGGTINWLTGSLHFAREDQISLYNAVHVGLTGIRGMIAPLFGLYLYSSRIFEFEIGGETIISIPGVGLGAGVFWVASVLSLLGAVVMLIQGMTDPGPRDE